jgi:hypothetical protein
MAPDEGKSLRPAGDSPSDIGDKGEQTSIAETEIVELGARKTKSPSKRIASERSRSSGRSRSSVKDEDPGAELERRVGRVEFADGALARLRVPIRAEGASPGRDVLTDIDVLSIDVDLRLRLSRSISECKSSGGQAGELDRLLWLAGLRSLLEVERAVLVREAVSGRGAALARALKIDLVDSKTLTEREAANAWLPERFAHIGGQECTAAEKRADTQIKAIGTIPPGLVAFLRHGTFLATSFESLSAVSALGEAVAESSVMPDVAGVVVAGHALQSLLCAALQDASRVGSISDDVLSSRLALALTTGHPDDSYVLDVLSRADDLVLSEFDRLHQSYVDAGSNRLPFEPTSLRKLVAEPPAWIDRYVDLVHRLRSSPTRSRDLFQTVELGVFEALVGGVAFKAEAFARLFTKEHRSLVSAAIRMLDEIVGKAVGDRLGALLDLDWSRTVPDIPDKRQDGDGDELTAELAEESPRTSPRL